MRSLTKKERETLIILFKDFTSFYNANSISKVLNISHVGAQKIFKRLLQENLVVNKTIGKSITYKLNFNENYVSQLIVFLLVDEANNFKRWREEFKEIFKKNRIVLLFGSTVKDYTHAREVKEINAFIKKKEEILPKKIHAIKLTASDLQESIKKKDNAMVDIIKNAIILYGQDEYVKMLKNAKNYGF